MYECFVECKKMQAGDESLACIFLWQYSYQIVVRKRGDLRYIMLYWQQFKEFI